MGKILIIDDTQFWRDTAADVLRGKGHTVHTAADGVDGLKILQSEGADLIVLDVEMPRMPGLSFLDQIRRDKNWKTLPVIMLTGDMVRDDVLRAKKLGAVDYMLKSRFEISNLIDRVQKRLGPQPVAQVTAPVVAAKLEIQPLLTFEQSLDRADRAMKGQTLPGVVAEVIALADSATTSLADLADLIGRDPLLAARVLQTANSAAFVSKRGVISTLSEAVRNIGSTTVRDIAISVGIFDSMPSSEADGFSPIQCWQHSLAVATLCRQLAPEPRRNVAHLVGLCHNLGEILFRSHFGAEYRKVLQAEKTLHKPRRVLEKEMLGITRGELAERILQRLELPAAILAPIASYHRADRTGVASTEPLARLLALAVSYAHAILLMDSSDSSLSPLTRTEGLSLTGCEDLPAPDGTRFRSEIFAMTAMYGRLSSSEEAEMLRSMPQRKPARVLLARDPAFSSFDPIAAALDGLVDLTIQGSPPTPDTTIDFQALVVLARSPSVAGFTASDIAAATARGDGKRLTTLWLTARSGDAAANSGAPVAMSCPVSLKALADFVQQV